MWAVSSGSLRIVSLFAIVIYSRFVNIRHDTAKAWAHIDVRLKRHHDELLKLVETCRQHMKHEREIVERGM